MIDFQNGGLEHHVYELILKMCDLACSDAFPRFETKQLENGKWECRLAIPGVKTPVIKSGNTEVESVNACAFRMLSILRNEYEKNQYDPSIEDSLFADNIEQFFDIEYDKRYRYYLCEADIHLNNNDTFARYLLQNYAGETTESIKDDGGEIDCISDIVTMRFLVKEKRKNYS